MSLFNWIHDFYENYTFWFFVSIFALVAIVTTTVIIISKRLRKKKLNDTLEKQITEIKLTTEIKQKNEEKEATTRFKQTESHTKYQPKPEIQIPPLKNEPIIPVKKPEQKIEIKKDPVLFEPNDAELITNKKKPENDFVKPFVQPIVKKKDGILYTGYKPPVGFSNPSPWTYPMVKFPKEKTIIREPREFKRQLRGYMENAFQKKLEEFFSNSYKVSGEDSIPTSASSRPYEPDISLITIQNQLNIFLDIEIDEPYAAIKRNPMHCIDADNLRDHFFTDRGWIVIRFTERQIKKEYKKCLAYVAKVLKSIDPTFIVPDELKAVAELTIEKQWTALEAQKWEKSKYREGYLGIESFGPVPLGETNQSLVLTEEEKKIESLVKSTVKIIGESGEAFEINKKNSHSRDKRIQFIEDGHIYLIDGVHARSVTELIDTCFPIYDEEYWSGYIASRDNRTAADVLAQWKKDGLQSQQLGTTLHQNIEKFYHAQNPVQNEEFQQFLNFHNAHKQLKAYRTEWRIFDEVNLIAGTIDLICKNEDGTFEIYDWKRSKKVVDPKTGNVLKLNGYNQNGIGSFSGLSDTSYSRYCLQQNVYRYLLETYYGIKIKNMYLVVMHPLLPNYYKIEVPKIDNEVKLLLSKNH